MLLKKEVSPDMELGRFFFSKTRIFLSALKYVE